MKRLLKYDLVGFLIASRIPSLLIIGSTQYLTAIFLVSDFQGKATVLASLSFLMLSLSTVLIAAAAYINNDYYDQKIDMINRPDRVVVGTLFRRRLAILAHFMMTILGIAIGFYLSPWIGLIHVLSSSFLWLYSNRLRRIPILGNLVISVSSGMTLLLVPIYLGRYEPLVYVYTIFAVSIILIREVVKDLEDVKGDQRFGVKTIPVFWGIRGAKVFIGVVVLGGILFLISFLVLVDNWMITYYFIALIPVLVWFIVKLILADTQKQYSSLRQITNVIIFTGLASMLVLKL